MKILNVTDAMKPKEKIMFEEFSNSVREIATWLVAFAACLFIAAIFMVVLKLIVKVLSFAWKLV